MILLDISDLESKKYSQQLSYMTYDFNLDNDIDIKPIVKSEEFFKKWVINYPFYASIQRESAQILFAAEEYKGANNRAYYAIFHAINAIHALNGKAYKRHKDAIGNFNILYFFGFSIGIIFCRFPPKLHLSYKHRLFSGFLFLWRVRHITRLCNNKMYFVS